MAAGQRVELAGLDAVTLDAYGTLLELDDPVERLAEVVPGFPRDEIARAFRAEAHYYAEHAHEGRDTASLARLRSDCTTVFNGVLGSSVSADEFVGALRFGFLPGALEGVDAIRRRGLSVAVVSNWDVELRAHLAPLDVLVVTSAEAGARKPSPRPLALALTSLGVAPDRALHIGDSEADAESARAAGVAFAPAPVAKVIERWL